MPNKSFGGETDIEDDEELPWPKTALTQALDDLQVVHKYIQKQREISDRFFYALKL